ncbi:citrate synthase [Herbihabitans rhizosphaerae]|uniref:Citrate synthase n=1 Tax=Herbihabitans rhizosphaerae TaxID=1872711 RepID=A0A4Q7KEP3_9PSEU|nr:citrate/2-methylcitrate synthase [Herbihabitans rhizosphaerae]RZS32724.1 citrate synthase [Herbihabitans rhizosphaerae]
MREPLIAPPGLKNVIVADTALGDVDGEAGFYHFRQYSAIELAEKRTFEEVWHLMFTGRLPDPAELAGFHAEIAAHQGIPDDVRAVLPVIAASGGERSTLAGLRTALSLLGAGFPASWGADPAVLRDNAIRIAAATPAILAALHRLRTGRDVIAPRADLSTAGNWLWMLTGSEPTPEHEAAINRYLICTIDHGFNASTFTARVVASAGADVASAICGAIGTFTGPLHGGAPDRALEALDEIGSPDRVRDWVRTKIATGDRIMGFGHPVYRTEDPRARMLREIGQKLGGPLIDFATRVEAEVVQALAELKPGRELHTNVEFYAGVVMEQCGIPRSMFTPTFAVSRVVGWAAQVLEQAEGTKIFRPSARYVGTTPPVPVPARTA